MDAILAAFNLTIPEDPGWINEREQLTLVEADLIDFESGAEMALKHLDASREFSSRLFHGRRAALLKRLDRSDDAVQAWTKAEQFPPDETVEVFLSGVAQSRRREFDGRSAELRNTDWTFSLSRLLRDCFRRSVSCI